ncbi:MAG: RING finger domain-containing protein [Promethearchaeota archaeon]
MVEKRVFDTMLATFMRSDPSIRIVALIDKEGLPISFAIKSRKFKIKPSTLGSLCSQAIYPLENYAINLKLAPALGQVYILEEAILILINLGIATLSILIDHSGWPLEPQKIDNLLAKLRPKLQEASEAKGGLLSKITGEQDKKYAINSFSSDSLRKISNLFYSFNEGKIDIAVLEPAQAPEIFTKAGNQFDAFLVDTENVILSMNPNYSPDFVLCTKETLDIENEGLNAFNAGKILAGLSYYSDSNCIADSIVGNYDNKNIFMFKMFKDWNIGFKSIISPFLNVANYLVAEFPSDESLNFISVINYLSNSVDELKEKVSILVKEKDFVEARKFMERVAILSIRNKNYMEAGDMYRWMAFTYYKEAETNQAIKLYEESAKFHKMAGDLDKFVDDYKEIATIFQNENKIPKAINNLIIAENILKESAPEKTDLLDDIINTQKDLLAPYLNKVENFIKSSKAEVLKFDYLAQKFGLDELLIIKILSNLIERGTIGGEIDHERKRYTKMKMLASAGTTKTGFKVRPLGQAGASQGASAPNSKSSTLPMKGEISYKQIAIETAKISSELSNLEEKMAQKEKVFAKYNIPFTQYLDYEQLLDRRQFLEHRLRIAENMAEYQNEDGSLKICPICFKDLKPTDILSQCPNGHKIHQSCLSIWIKNQDACPVCGAPLFPYILKTTSLNAKDVLSEDENKNILIIQDLQNQIAQLQSEIDNINAMNNVLKSLDGDSKLLLQKLTRERDLKSKMEQELKRKDLTIKELKSMIKLFKK